MTLSLTENEAENVAEFIEIRLFEEIRDNVDIDNINWLVSMIHAYEKLKEFSGYVGLYDNDEEGGELMKCCGECKHIYWERGDDDEIYWVCGNEDSDNCEHSVLCSDSCEDFEEKEIE